MKTDTHGSPPDVPHAKLTAAQRAAVAKLAYALEQPWSVAVLCGPEGVGKTTVLGHVGRLEIAAESPGPRPLLLDDADRLSAAELAGILDDSRRGRHEAVVLAGTGRLLSLLAADPRLERMVGLRVAVPAFSREESSRLVEARLPARSLAAFGPEVCRTIHEIAAGMPATVIRLADVAGLFVAADPERQLIPDDIEAIHRRLSVNAA